METQVGIMCHMSCEQAVKEIEMDIKVDSMEKEKNLQHRGHSKIATPQSDRRSKIQSFKSRLIGI